MSQSRRGLAEEQPLAYKNVNDVVDVVHNAGLSHKVARMRPIGVIKGRDRLVQWLCKNVINGDE